MLILLCFLLLFFCCCFFFCCFFFNLKVGRICSPLILITRMMRFSPHVFRGKIVSGPRKLTTFANCSSPASPILIVEGSVYTRNILSFIPAEDIDQIKLAFTYQGLKHTGGSIRGMQPTSERTFLPIRHVRLSLICPQGIRILFLLENSAFKYTPSYDEVNI